VNYDEAMAHIGSGVDSPAHDALAIAAIREYVAALEADAKIANVALEDWIERTLGPDPLGDAMGRINAQTLQGDVARLTAERDAALERVRVLEMMGWMALSSMEMAADENDDLGTKISLEYNADSLRVALGEEASDERAAPPTVSATNPADVSSRLVDALPESEEEMNDEPSE